MTTNMRRAIFLIATLFTACKPTANPEAMAMPREERICYRVVRGLQAGRVPPEMVGWYVYNAGQSVHFGPGGTISYSGWDDVAPAPAAMDKSGGVDPSRVVAWGKLDLSLSRLIPGRGPPVTLLDVTCSLSDPVPEAKPPWRQMQITFAGTLVEPPPGREVPWYSFAKDREPLEEPASGSCFSFDVAANKVYTCAEVAAQRRSNGR